MIVYATHKGGKYIPVAESFRIQPSGKRNIYVNITNRCNCDCVFCLRHMKKMRDESSLWFKEEPTTKEIKEALDSVPWDYVRELVFCGFGEPTMRLDALLELLAYAKKRHPHIPTRLNTNGLAELEYGASVTANFSGLLDTISISLNASNAERYLQLTRAKYGISAYEGMLSFAVHCKEYIPNVIMTVVEKVEDDTEIDLCRKICESRGLKLRVRTYENS